MNELRKVLVVDSGSRASVDALSAELAGLGFSSVTTSVEAADDVLSVIPRPAAIFLKMPTVEESQHYGSFLALAERLRGPNGTGDIPVIVWDRERLLDSGGISAVMQHQFGPQVLASPDF
ncbi:MAG: hypothetical protein JWR08_2620 [Enterovirga sp.]|jgi:hypothetical protein|nr:hypothetical protein [Enterovirga sp.]